MQTSRLLVLCWLAVAPLASLHGEQAADQAAFEAEMAEGLWFLGQDAAFEAARHFEKAATLRPQDGFPRYLLGFSHLRQGKAQEAVAEIEASLKAWPPPPVERSRILVDLGAAQLAAGDPQAAVRTLKRALRRRQKDAIALSLYAKALGQLGEEEKADEALASARRLRPGLDPENLPIELPELADLDSAAEKAQSWGGTVDFVVGRDSNPNLLSKDLLLPNPSSDTELVSGSESDSVASVDLRMTFEPSLRLAKGWSLAVDFRGGGSFHQDFDYLNLVGTGALIQLARGADPRGFLEGPLGATPVSSGELNRWTLLLQGGFDEFWLDGTSYLKRFDAAGSVTFSPSTKNATRLEVSFQDRSYFRHPLADPRRNGEEARIGVRQIRYLGSDRFVTVGIATSDRNADSAFDRSLLEEEVEAVFPIGPHWTFRLNGLAYQEEFDDRASNLFDPEGLARKDKTWSVFAAATREFSRGLLLLVRGGYQNRDSNVSFSGDLPALDYQRTIVEAGLSWTFPR